MILVYLTIILVMMIIPFALLVNHLEKYTYEAPVRLVASAMCILADIWFTLTIIMVVK